MSSLVPGHPAKQAKNNQKKKSQVSLQKNGNLAESQVTSRLQIKFQAVLGPKSSEPSIIHGVLDF